MNQLHSKHVNLKHQNKELKYENRNMKFRIKSSKKTIKYELISKQNFLQFQKIATKLQSNVINIENNITIIINNIINEFANVITQLKIMQKKRSTTFNQKNQIIIASKSSNMQLNSFSFFKNFEFYIVTNFRNDFFEFRTSQMFEFHIVEKFEKRQIFDDFLHQNEKRFSLSSFEKFYSNRF